MLRQLLSIMLLPFLVVVVVPAWLLAAFTADDVRWVDAAPTAWLVRALGLALFVIGLGLFCWCVSLFARVGQGTLATWDPTRSLVIVEPYRYVRNPMISGVAAMLGGEALLWGSVALGVWACAFILINHTYFLLLEEPGLEKRFGESYCVYKANVPRWIPRLKSWRDENREGDR